MGTSIRQWVLQILTRTVPVAVHRTVSVIAVPKRGAICLLQVVACSRPKAGAYRLDFACGHTGRRCDRVRESKVFAVHNADRNRVNIPAIVILEG